MDFSALLEPVPRRQGVEPETRHERRGGAPSVIRRLGLYSTDNRKCRRDLHKGAIWSKRGSSVRKPGARHPFLNDYMGLLTKECGSEDSERG